MKKQLKATLNRFFAFLDNTKTFYLSSMLWAAGFIAFLATILLGYIVTGNGLQPFWVLSGSYIMLILWGSPGLIFIVRREYPRFTYTIRGTPAVVIGVLWLTFWWGIVILNILLFAFVF